jgi:hypothetical protein
LIQSASGIGPEAFLCAQIPPGPAGPGSSVIRQRLKPDEPESLLPGARHLQHVLGEEHLAVQAYDIEVHIQVSIAIENLGSCWRFNPEGMAVPDDRNLRGFHDSPPIRDDRIAWTIQIRDKNLNAAVDYVINKMDGSKTPAEFR